MAQQRPRCEPLVQPHGGGQKAQAASNFERLIDDIETVDRGATRRRLQERRQAAQSCGFSGVIRPKECVYLPGRHRKGHILDRPNLVISLHQSVQNDHVADRVGQFGFESAMSKILFAEDDRAMREMVADVLTSAGHVVQTVSDGNAAMEAVRHSPPELIILDYRMGHPNGFEVCRQIKSDPGLEHLPVLVLTAESDVEDRILGFQAGANDYLPKPFDARELLARVSALLRLSEQGRELNPTTGLPGGTAIDREFERRRLAGRPFTLCYLDLDYFKALNDRFGFAAANTLIENLGSILRRTISGTDNFAGHIGGDDFVLICEPRAAHDLVTRVQKDFMKAVARVIPADVLARGTYVGRTRDGKEEDIPLTRIAAALLRIAPDAVPTFERLGEVAAEAKQLAKIRPGSGIVQIDVRV